MSQPNIPEYLKPYEPFIQGIVELFDPFVEAAVHDLKKGKIVALYHNLSKRKIGDISPLAELKVSIDEFPDYFPAYYKRNWDGRQLKCTSITIRDKGKKPVGLICFNVDVSFMQDTQRLLEIFLTLKTESENPIEMYGGSCEEQAENLIQKYLSENELHLSHLNRSHKQQLVQHLYHQGIFNFKNAVPFVSNYLKISRASIYNYINNIGKEK